jgi:hypothetical protein
MQLRRLQLHMAKVISCSSLGATRCNTTPLTLVFYKSVGTRGNTNASLPNPYNVEK